MKLRRTQGAEGGMIIYMRDSPESGLPAGKDRFGTGI